MHVKVHLAHGAAGGPASMAAHVEGLARRGIEAAAVALPKGRAEAAVAVYRAAAPPGRGVVVGGHSYGGRVASLLVALAEGYAGLVLLSYPLHRPGAGEWEARTEHWPAISCPVLLLSGESDPFARLDLLRAAVAERLPSGQLVTYPGVRHGLGPVLDDALDRVADFVRRLG